MVILLMGGHFPRLTPATNGPAQIDTYQEKLPQWVTSASVSAGPGESALTTGGYSYYKRKLLSRE
jgi:hypothetical protein